MIGLNLSAHCLLNVDVNQVRARRSRNALGIEHFRPEHYARNPSNENKKFLSITAQI